MVKQTLILVRHAQSTGQSPEAELTALGVEQANALIERLGALSISGVYSSPYRRAQATIFPFAERAGLPVTVVDDLRERALLAKDQDWLDHVERSFADIEHRLPGGESLSDARGRALSAISEIAGANLAVAAAVSHGNLIASVLNFVDQNFGFAQWRAMRNPDLFEITLKGGQPAAFRRLD